MSDTGMGATATAGSSNGDEATSVGVSVDMISFAMGASASFGSSHTFVLSSSGGEGLGAMVSAVNFQALSKTEFHENDVDAGVSTGVEDWRGDGATSKRIGEATVTISGAGSMLGTGSSDECEGGESEIGI